MRGKFWIVIIIFVMLSIPASIYSNVYCMRGKGEGIESELTNDWLNQGNPAIYLDRVVWTEDTQENGKTNWEIFLYVLSVDTDSDGEPNYLDDDDDGDGTPDIQDPDLDPAKIQITSAPLNQTSPAIYGDFIVWEDERHGNFDIYMYDLAKDTDRDGIPNYMDEDRPDPDPAEIRVTDNPAAQEAPSIYGTKIVWMDSRYGNKDVFIYNVITGEEALIAGLNEFYEKPPLQTNPKIYGDKVVWEEKMLYVDSEIFMYNLSVDSDEDGIPNYLDDNRQYPDPAEVQITDNTQYDNEPSIYEELIAFSRSDNVFLYDLQTGTEYKLTNSTTSQKIDGGLCSIHGSKVVWVYVWIYPNETREMDIYLYDLAKDSDKDGVPDYKDSEEDGDAALMQVTYESEKISMTPAIHSNTIVWQDKRNRSKPVEIYIFKLTENLPPELTYFYPESKSEITEGETLRLDISVSDPEEDEISYFWYLDEFLISGEDKEYYEYIPDYNSAGIHEIKVVATDNEFPVEKIWIVHVAESGLEPIEIRRIHPVINPVIIEGESIELNIWVDTYISGALEVNWSWPEDPIFDGADEITTSNGLIHSKNNYHTHIDYNESINEKQSRITVEISKGMYSVNYTWLITVLYFDDTDMDGYSDAKEVNYNSDPLDKSDTPMDTDHDLIVDFEDKDKDGDGLLDKHDGAALDVDKQLDANPDSSIGIITMIISLILVIIAIVTLPGISKP